MTDQDAASAVPAWIAIPQPTTSVLEGGWWQPAAVRVVADEPAFSREAVRLEEELSALGIRSGERQVVRLRRGPLQGESFEIVVGDDVEIFAGSPAGAFRATRQLLHNLRAQGAVPRGRVVSAPAVAERGFHLDAARKHFPAEWIEELLRGLADVGVNAFQWHFSENEGFRLESAAFPEIVSTAHIGRAEAARLIEVAADLHIAVIPSLDMPGHLRHVLSAHPELRLPGGDGLDTDHALDITREDAVRFALALIDDMIPVFSRSAAWNLGADEFVDFARIGDYPALAHAARERFGPHGSGFDLLTEFTNRVAAHLRAAGFAPRVWNDGMLRGEVVRLDPGVTLTWWTNWHAAMRPLADALGAGLSVVNVNDGLFYYVLGEKAGYRYPTSERIWAEEWHPGVFPRLPGGERQELVQPYPRVLRGVCFAVWSDDPAAQTPGEVAAGVRRPLRALAERAWNAGSRWTHDEFCEVDEAIGDVRGGRPPTGRGPGLH